MKFEVGQDRAQVHFLVAYMDAPLDLARFKDIIGFDCPEAIIKVFDEKYTSLYSTQGLNKLLLFLENKTAKLPGLFFDKIEQVFHLNYKKAIEILNKKYSQEYQNLQATLLSIKLIAVYITTLRYIEVAVTKHLKNSLIKNKLRLTDDELFKLTFAESYTSMVTMENLQLFKIAIKFYDKQNSPEINKYLKRHAKKFSYVELHASTKPLLTETDFRKRLYKLFKFSKTELKEKLKNLQNNHKNIKQEKLRLKEKYIFNDFEKQIIKILESISEIKVKLTDWLCLLNYNIVSIAGSLSEKWNIKRRDFYLLFPEEIIAFCKNGKFDKRIIAKLEERKRAVIWYKNGAIKTIFGEKAEMFIKHKITEETIIADEIQGTPIFRGKFQGVVKIIKSPKDFRKIKTKDILVTSDATPDFAPIFKKVAGIITDEGGVICHAAIVAREMKIPCIVGTKIATKVLKDGDLVELDAEEGIIRKVKKQNYEQRN